MTTLLEEAIRQTTILSDREQDFIASVLLENIRDSQQWDEKFAASKDVLEEMFDEAMTEYKSGRTTPLGA